jgi:hypothetical protein
MMTKIELNKPILNLDGSPIEGSNLGKLLSQMLAGSNKGDALKFMAWALKLHAGESIELDPTDKEVLKSFILSNEQLTNLSKAQMLECFN